ncbi:MAG TPA: molybdopterin cofactor-binding domain-containing protein [Acetobacteraceae bacterium]|nr:molybdopterin cofactor-binding domain-containing protein [Acetobacteraceae bacterium]
MPSAFPNGCHIAEIELDPDIGMVDIVRYTTVSDFGVLVNPMLVEGQAHGGIAQGVGRPARRSVSETHKPGPHCVTWRRRRCWRW